MDADKRSRIASQGGKAAHAQGKAHKFTPEEARIAGRKGGLAPHRSRDYANSLGTEPGAVQRSQEREFLSNPLPLQNVTPPPLPEQGKFTPQNPR
jgi:hypothetical protein